MHGKNSFNKSIDSWVMANTLLLLKLLQEEIRWILENPIKKCQYQRQLLFLLKVSFLGESSLPRYVSSKVYHMADLWQISFSSIWTLSPSTTKLPFLILKKYLIVLIKIPRQKAPWSGSSRKVSITVETWVSWYGASFLNGKDTP